jgi:DNA-binding transcriptional LysR family regulator
VCAQPSAASACSRRLCPLPVSALGEARWLLREPGSGTRETVEQMLLPHLGQVSSAMQPGSTEAIMQAAAAGLGLACLSRYAVRDLVALGRLVVLPTELPKLVRRFYVVRHRAKHVSAGLERFFRSCRLGAPDADASVDGADDQRAPAGLSDREA